MLKLTQYLSLCIAFTLISSCAATRTYTYNAGDRSTICNSHTTDLGNTAVLLEFAWRSDQKDPEERKQMAFKEVAKVFNKIPCGVISSDDSIKNYDSSIKPEVETLNTLSNKGIDSVIIIRIEELTPRLEFTFSLPFLWSGSNEADFHIRVISTHTGRIFNDMRVKRFTGGPFNIRPAQWSGAELNAALRDIIKKDD